MKNRVPQNIYKRLVEYLPSQNGLIISRAPGRINLIGEHTDYNKGLVLPGAIDRYMYFAFVPNGTSTIKATAIDKSESITIDLENLNKTQYLWGDFLTGILLEFKKIKTTLPGFDCSFTSEVPMGAGMSSSSALECAFLIGLQQLYGSQLDKWDLVKMSQSSNHNFLKIQGGIMDQFASLFGNQDHVMLLDCATSEYQYVHLPKSEYAWLLINTCVKHNHLISGYNDRVRDCKEALSCIQKVLPHVNHLSEIKNPKELDKIHFSSVSAKNRAEYIVAENDRVRHFIRAIKERDFASCGSLLYASHEGLSKKYEVSCEELDFLVDTIKNNPAVLGARMMGGGFGGCTLNLVAQKAIPQIKKDVAASYFKAYNRQPEFYDVAIVQGAEVLLSGY